MAERQHSILYVDDEQQNLRAFQASFRRHYRVHLASSGPEAIELLRGQPVDLIISDQRMPGMTGVELFEKILPEFPEPLRMVMTGYSDIEAIVNAINKGKIYYYITKPWNQQELKLIIDRAMETRALRRQNTELEAEKTLLLLRAEKQKKENLLSQFETLKNQVNPHFLFNCLNTLSGLVHENPDLAEDFIAQLTRVYRYVLELRNETSVTLERELQVLKAFFFLQKLRFEEKIKMKVSIDGSCMERYLPPLTLQLLVENAIKHNVVSSEAPLMVEIYNQGPDRLVVKNNFQAREDAVSSTGIGLRNLKERFAFLSDMSPEFVVREGNYLAIVPLLQAQQNPD